MPKINIRVSLKNPEFETEKELTGIYQDGVLKYIEEDGSKVTINYNNDTLKKDEKFYRLNFDFKKETLKVKLKELDIETKTEIKTNKILKDNLNLTIEYEVEDDNFIYRIEELK